MKIRIACILTAICLFAFSTAGCYRTDNKKVLTLEGRAKLREAQALGQLGDQRLVECSGMDVSLVAENRFWAINDGSHGPFIYALGMDGRSMGRIFVEKAKNRDWEDLSTFLWKGRPMMLIADFGDNNEEHDTHTLYIIEEPRLQGEDTGKTETANVAWRIVFSYPDGGHDAEAVAVDPDAGKVLVLTKRDKPPLLYELPLEPVYSERPLLAQKIGKVQNIPPPSKRDLLQKYGKYRSQPTALDFSPDLRRAVVLTYKHAYIFIREKSDSWAAALTSKPLLAPLPLPQNRKNLRQREAICFAPDSRSLFVTSEGLKAGIYFLEYALSPICHIPVTIPL